MTTKAKPRTRRKNPSGVNAAPEVVVGPGIVGETIFSHPNGIAPAPKSIEFTGNTITTIPGSGVAVDGTAEITNCVFVDCTVNGAPIPDGFYSKFGDWARPPRLMMEDSDIRNREFAESQREDPLGYWAAFRDEMI